MTSTSKTYCPACAEDAGPVGHCPRCGLALSENEGSGLIDLTGLEAPPALYETIVVAEDTDLMSEILRDGLVAAGIADKVLLTYDGRDFLSRCAELMYADQRIDLAIIDLEMPILRGEPSAIALRAFEDGCHAARAPIIFFTAQTLDDRLRALMRALKPAHYLNKGQDASPQRIIKRVREIVRALQM